MKKLLLLLSISIIYTSCKRQSPFEQLHGDSITIADSTQQPSAAINTEETKYPSFCDTLTAISEKDFVENRAEPVAIKPNSSFVKKNGIIRVPGTAITFEDDMTGEGYQEFTPLGNLTPNLYVVAETTYHLGYYHLINNKTKAVYHLVGPA